VVGELQDALRPRTGVLVDGLAVVPHDSDALAPTDEQLDKFELDGIGVLWVPIGVGEKFGVNQPIIQHTTTCTLKHTTMAETTRLMMQNLMLENLKLMSENKKQKDQIEQATTKTSSSDTKSINSVHTTASKAAKVDDSLNIAQLKLLATKLDIAGRSSMNKQRLIDAINEDSGRTVDQLYMDVKKMGLTGLSKATRAQLIDAKKGKVPEGYIKKNQNAFSKIK
jgi:hypothetical protein